MAPLTDSTHPCCPPDAQDDCCDASDKDACCGAEASSCRCSERETAEGEGTRS